MGFVEREDSHRSVRVWEGNKGKTKMPMNYRDETGAGSFKREPKFKEKRKVKEDLKHAPKLRRRNDERRSIQESLELDSEE